MLQNYLTKHKIKYVFMTVDYTIFKPNIVLDKTLKTLIADIDMSKVIDPRRHVYVGKKDKTTVLQNSSKESHI